MWVDPNSNSYKITNGQKTEFLEIRGEQAE